MSVFGISVLGAIDFAYKFETMTGPYYIYNYIGFFAILWWNLRHVGEKAALYSAPVVRKGQRIREKTGHLNPTLLRKAQKREMILLSLIQYLSGDAMNKLDGMIFNGGDYNYFGFAILAPWILIGYCCQRKIDPFGHLDLMTPAYALSLMFFKLGCYQAGCCGGISIPFEYPYPSGPRARLPIQLIEAAVALIIFFVLRRRRAKMKPGTMQPLYLILYSAIRFFTEFLRGKASIFFYFKAYHFFCVAGVIIGLIEYKLISRRSGQITAIPLRWQAEAAVKKKVKKKKTRTE